MNVLFRSRLGRAQLKIYDIDSSHAGEYILEASTGQVTAEESIELIINGKSENYD